jgi:hypothetical protein
MYCMPSTYVRRSSAEEAGGYVDSLAASTDSSVMVRTMCKLLRCRLLRMACKARLKPNEPRGHPMRTPFIVPDRHTLTGTVV